MSDLYNMFSKRRKSVLYNSSKEFQDEVDRQEKIEREEVSIKLQIDLTKRLQYLETILQKQRETDRLERQKEREADYIERQQERYSDRWFAAKTLIISAVIGGLIVKLIDFILK